MNFENRICSVCHTPIGKIASYTTKCDHSFHFFCIKDLVTRPNFSCLVCETGINVAGKSEKEVEPAYDRVSEKETNTFNTEKVSGRIYTSYTQSPQCINIGSGNQFNNNGTGRQTVYSGSGTQFNNFGNGFQFNNNNNENISQNLSFKYEWKNQNSNLREDTIYLEGYSEIYCDVGVHIEKDGSIAMNKDKIIIPFKEGKTLFITSVKRKSDKNDIIFTYEDNTKDLSDISTRIDDISIEEIYNCASESDNSIFEKRGYATRLSDEDIQKLMNKKFNVGTSLFNVIYVTSDSYLIISTNFINKKKSHVMCDEDTSLSIRGKGHFDDLCIKAKVRSSIVCFGSSFEKLRIFANDASEFYISKCSVKNLDIEAGGFSKIKCSMVTERYDIMAKDHSSIKIGMEVKDTFCKRMLKDNSKIHVVKKDV